MTGSTSRNIQVSVPAPDERPGKRAWQAVGVSAVGYAMDGFDLLILGFALTAITATFSLSGTQAGSLATITLLGAVLGGFVGGILSDYIGRVKVLTYSILIFAVFTALTGLSPNFALLTVFRFLAGVGLGAEFGVGMTLAAETWPAKMRARATSYVALGWQAGVLLAAIVAAWAIPTIGWRGLFMLGAIPAVFAFFVRKNVDEPALFEERRHEAKEKFPLMQLFRDAETSKSAVGMFVLCSVQNFGYFGLMIWLPSYLAKQYGFGLTKSAVWTGVTVLGMAAGIFIFGQLADRFGRRPMLFVFQAGAAISVLAYSRIDNEVTLLIGGAIMGVFVNGMLGGYGALMAELFPTTARATAENVLFNLGRGVGGFAPLVIAAVAAAYSFQLAIGLLSVIYVIDIIATVFLIPERKGLALE
ncbi:MAG: MFS transporter [Dermatophilaceae bacterium]